MAKLAGDSKSYAERLFECVSISSLNYEDAKKALLNPATSQGVSFTEEAVEYIIYVTEGYPYFLQEYGKQEWNPMNDKKIDLKCAKEAEKTFFSSLDNSFFKCSMIELQKKRKTLCLQR